jgi:hypothetical protein
VVKSNHHISYLLLRVDTGKFAIKKTLVTSIWNRLQPFGTKDNILD